MGRAPTQIFFVFFLCDFCKKNLPDFFFNLKDQFINPEALRQMPINNYYYKLNNKLLDTNDWYFFQIFMK